MTEAIYRRPGDYDLEHEGDDEDVRALSRLVCARQPRRVLELGAGSGRLAIPLARLGAQKGFDVVGLEPAPEMRAGAEEKCSLEPADVQRRLSLEAGDMRTWISMTPFDVIVCACSTVAHLLTLEDQLAAWRSSFANLRKDGVLIVDVVMPPLVAYVESLQTPPRSLVELDLDTQDPLTGTRMLRYKTTRYLAHEQRARIRFLYDKFLSLPPNPAATHVERYVSDFESHVYFPRELQLLYLCAGFVVEAIYGDYRLRPLHEDSGQMIIVGRRPDGDSPPFGPVSALLPDRR